MFASLFLDHFGWLGYQVQPINGLRMLGVALLLGGVVLIRIFWLTSAANTPGQDAFYKNLFFFVSWCLGG
ncbi:hypothetical protein D1AOALGA4SA_4830 [Olavius algarvensis Delta 1 endosymbiont]|nr:hypothetical protein D1AOALGA4SA_4830 [Olavius algarvensis Delta 1 endosymbiont]